jgi:hypothetical protein
MHEMRNVPKLSETHYREKLLKVKYIFLWVSKFPQLWPWVACLSEIAFSMVGMLTVLLEKHSNGEEADQDAVPAQHLRWSLRHSVASPSTYFLVVCENFPYGLFLP